jgi:hypothetical protein
MSQITINTISGASPFTIYVCDTFELNCILSLSGVTTTPIDVPLPSAFTYSPAVLIKIVDVSGCTDTQVYSCISPTPTPSVTVTPTVTSTITPTPPITPSITPTYVAPSPTPTSSITPTLTPTPTITPSTTSQPNERAKILIEPHSASTKLGSYMYNKGFSFLGFSNDTSPTKNQISFDVEMNNYLDYSGWTNNELLSISIPVANSSNGFDGFNNPKSIYNFLTVILSASTIKGESWFSIIIPTGLTNGFFQKEVGVSDTSANYFTGVKTDSTIYSYTFTYTGYNFNRTTYRLYTTFPSTEMLLDNTDTSIYLKGNVAGI